MMMPAHEAEPARSWSDLPLNILELISDHLIGPDHCCFLAVCKTWRSIYFSMEAVLRKKMKVPILLSMKSDSTFYFSNPILCPTPEIANSSYNKNFKPSDETGEKSDHSCHSRDKERRIIFAKDGWLLMSQGEESVFFFNPMTGQRIDLPELPSSFISSNIFGLSFSTTPASMDCVVFGITFHGHFVVVLCIRHGQDSWTEHLISTDRKLESSYSSSPVFHNGHFYHMATTGNLIAYNPEKWSELVVLENPKQPCASVRECYLIECDGKLMSVFMGFMGQWVKAYWFDTSSAGNWKKINNMQGDNIFFVGELGSLSLTTTDLQISGLENRIYFPRYSIKNGTGIFYNLQTSKFQSFWDQQQDLYNSSNFSNCAWIQPNHQMYKDEELNWLHHVE